MTDTFCCVDWWSHLCSWQVTAADKLDRGEFRLPKKHEKDKAKKGVKGKHDEDETKTCIIS